jgi:serine/threonine protein kinase/Tol biopolymer transport system component
MALSPGSSFGPYEIISVLGIGGMGKVFRARDTKLGRDVAIKVLPDLVAADTERLARFQREAQMLASLNHPNIAHVYGLEESAGIRAIVMELVDGPTLADRIAEGPIAVADAVPIARQLAEALEAAHERGIIHRDLKPANVKVRADGVVKVLDFGLAKSLDPSAGHADAMSSPTLSLHATQAGVILGTAAYMAPEQARGANVDKRADIWAFGVILFEMLTGSRLFSGQTISDTLAAVLKTEPDWSALPAMMPRDLRRLLRLCLEKDVRRRLQAIGDARVQIEALLSGTADPADSASAAIAVPPSMGRRLLSSTVTTALGVVLGAGLMLLLWRSTRGVTPPPSLRLSTELGGPVSLGTPVFGASAILSPDGTMLAFVARAGADRSQLYVRLLTQLRATPLSGTDDADSPFFSPDGQWIAFFAAGKLKKISVTGGGAVTLCDVPNGRGGAWREDGTIVFTPSGREGAGLMRVPSTGGNPEPQTSPTVSEVSHRWPQWLPGGKVILFTGGGSASGYDSASLLVQTVSTGAVKVVYNGGYYGRYLPSGHLIFIRDGTLFAAAFDLNRLEVIGRPAAVLQNVSSNSISGTAQFDFSANGTLVYLPGQTTGAPLPIQWMDRLGKTTPLRTAAAPWINLRVAPSGDRLALQIFDARSDIWIYEWGRDALTRLTFDRASNMNPTWTPDSGRIAFASMASGTSAANLYWQKADGTGDAQRLTESPNPQYPYSWHPSGRFLAFQEDHPQTNSDLMILPVEGNDASGWKAGKPTAFLNTPFTERGPMFSPDGRWLGYVSNESGGRFEVYVRPFPGPGGKWQVSTAGGDHPTWSRSRQELFYGFNGQIMVVPFTVDGDSFRAERPRSWSDGRYTSRATNRTFDLHPDGDRFALAAAQAPDGAGQDKVVFIFNFFDELRRIVPSTR